MKERLLIYGATGYTGRLLAKEAAKRRLPVVLAGRHRERLASLAEELDLPYCVFGLESPAERKRRLDDDAKRPIPGPSQLKKLAAEPQPAPKLPDPGAAVRNQLADVSVVLNAAGPFAETAMPLARACVKTRTHYVDISGEYDVFRELNGLDRYAKEHETLVVPGAGLTVLASDCLIREAVYAACQRGMGAPHTVRVALSRVPVVSRGSVRTMLDGVRDGVRVVRNGKDEFYAAGTLVRSFSFGAEAHFDEDDARVCTAMSLADTFTAGMTASRAFQGMQQDARPVPNVEAYLEASGIERLAYELGGEFSLALRSQPLKLIVDRVLAMWPEGPRDEERDETTQQVVVEIEDRYRRGVEARLCTENSYDFTVDKALAVCEALAANGPKEKGVVSPAWVLPGAILKSGEERDTTPGWGDWCLKFRGLPRARELGTARQRA